MLTYNMDVEPRSRWLRSTPGAAALAQPYYCTEAGQFFGRQRFSTARTDKESYILFYTLEGEGLIEQGGTQQLLPQGMALLLNCRTPQSYCTAPGQRRWYHYWAHIDGAGVRAMEPLLIPGQKLAPARMAGVDMARWFEALLGGMQDGTTETMLDAGLTIHQLLTAVAKAQLRSAVGLSNREMILQAARTLRENYARPLCLDDLLAAAPVSKSYFLRLFRQYMGTTPYNYLLCYRITQAKELLVLTDLPVGSVARAVGFGDESNFSTRFTAMTGQSPLQYRKSALKPAGQPEAK